MGAFLNFANNVQRLSLKRGRPPKFNANQFYPRHLERALKEATAKEFMRVFEQFKKAALQGFTDDIKELSNENATVSTEFAGELDRIANEIVANAQNNLVKFSEMTIGKPYYPTGLENTIKENWTATFQALCISAETDAKAKIAAALSKAHDLGCNKYQTEKLVEELLPKLTKHRAELISRTETGKLNNAATMATYKGAGIEYYKWLSCIDDRTRPTHAALNNCICAVGDPESYFEENETDPLHPIKHARTSGMYIGEPGTDFQCRCSCIPWDPEIDGMYEVKEQKPEVKTPEQVATQANTEAEAAQAKAEKAVAEARAAQARANNLAAANARHAARTDEEKERIVAKYELAHPTSAMPDKFTKPEEVIDFFAKMDRNLFTAKIGKIAQNGDFYFGSILSSANGSTNIRGEINLSAKARDNIVSAMNKIKNKQSDTLTLEEFKWMSTLWHEITHNKHKNLDNSDFICGRTIGTYKKTSDYKIQCMELLNEYVARQTLPEFYNLLKIDMKFPELMKARDNTGYDLFMQRFDYTLDYFNINRAAALKQIKQGLFYDEYIFNQDKVLENFFAANIKGIKPKQIKLLVNTILAFSQLTPALDRFKTKLLDPLRNEIETANSKKKRAKK